MIPASTFSFTLQQGVVFDYEVTCNKRPPPPPILGTAGPDHHQEELVRILPIRPIVRTAEYPTVLSSAAYFRFNRVWMGGGEGRIAEGARAVGAVP